MSGACGTATTVVTLALGVSMGVSAPVLAASDGDSGKAPPGTEHVVVLEPNEINPIEVTLADGDRLTFRNASADAIKLSFRGKGDLAKNIRCAKSAGSVPGPALDDLIGMMGDELGIVVPPGPFPGSCTFATGDYTFGVRPDPAPDDALTPLEGQIFAK